MWGCESAKPSGLFLTLSLVCVCSGEVYPGGESRVRQGEATNLCCTHEHAHFHLVD